MPFLDGDDFHPAANVAKMSAGIPLTDEDRIPWLERCADEMLATDGSVLACSSLRRTYRKIIREKIGDVIFVYLAGSRELLLQRMSQRQGHFMKAQMLDSQLATLEPLEPDEPGFRVDIAASEPEIASQILEGLKSKN